MAVAQNRRQHHLATVHSRISTRHPKIPKKLGITQEVFAHILRVNIAAVISWEKASTTPHPKHRKIIRKLKMMDEITLQHLIQESKTALYE